VVYHLKSYPNSQGGAVTGIAVDLARQGTSLSLRYTVTGAIGAVHWPRAAMPARTDGLWQHTCFEAFIRTAGRVGYCELNFAPSTAWAAYRFIGYREGMSPLEIAAPRIESRSSAESYELAVTIVLDTASLPAGGIWQLGISAVIEEMNGRKSYWALAHPASKPDFHHADSFTIELPA
jgi:hypothetical protein